MKFDPQGPIDNKSAIGLVNGKAPIRRQAIIGNNAHPILWRIYAALGKYELISWFNFYFHGDLFLGV